MDTWSKNVYGNYYLPIDSSGALTNETGGENNRVSMDANEYNNSTYTTQSHLHTIPAARTADEELIQQNDDVGEHLPPRDLLPKKESIKATRRRGTRSNKMKKAAERRKYSHPYSSNGHRSYSAAPVDDDHHSQMYDDDDDDGRRVDNSQVSTEVGTAAAAAAAASENNLVSMDVKKYNNKNSRGMNQSELRNGHVATAVSAGVGRYKCDQCEKSYKRRPDLTRHRIGAHTEGGKPFSCEICNQTFTQQGSVKRHMATHNKDKVLEFKCTLGFCGGVSFRTKDSRKNHEKGCEKRSLDRAHKCELCLKRFKQSFHLYRHIREAHTSS